VAKKAAKREVDPTIVKKLNPGQYAALPRSTDYLRVMDSARVPGLRGFLIRCTMRQLEPTQGNYDFTSILAPLAYCEKHGLQLVVMLVDKTFAGNERPLPVYLSRLELPNRANGYTAARWRAEYVWRVKALLRAIGLRFDKHPNFESVSLQESSLSLNDKELNSLGYTPELYRDALIAVITSADTAMPNTRIHWHMNYLPEKQSYVGQVCEAMVPGGHLLGGPDWKPDAYILQRSCYPFYVQFKDKLTTFIDNQYESYKHPHRKPSPTKYWTPAELYDSAKAQIFNDFYFWTFLPKPHLADSYCYFDAVPVIARDAVTE
jgi:hypothetical protein